MGTKGARAMGDAEAEDQTTGWSDLSWRFRGAIIAVGLLVIFAVGFVLAFGLAVGTGQDQYTTPQLLLTATSVTLLFWSVIVAALAFIGWGRIKDAIDEHARKAVEKQAQGIEDDFAEVRDGIRGYMHLVSGVLYGRISTVKRDDELLVEDEEYLAQAIVHLERAMERLRGRDDEIIAKNSLAFAYALADSPEYARTAKQFALDLRKDPSYSSNPAYINTYARVVASYHGYFDNSSDALREARDTLEAMLDNPSVSESEKRNARRHLTVLNRALLEDGEGE